MKTSTTLEQQAKSIVAHSFRNGPIEDVHAGEPCPVCEGETKYSHITQDEMKSIMKHAVDWVFTLLLIRADSPELFDLMVRREPSSPAAGTSPSPSSQCSSRPCPPQKNPGIRLPRKTGSGSPRSRPTPGIARVTEDTPNAGDGDGSPRRE